MDADMADGPPTPSEREAFLAERRRVAQARFDQLFASTYDQTWAETMSTDNAAKRGHQLYGCGLASFIAGLA